MAEIVTSRVSAGIYPAAADVGRTLNSGYNALTIPAEYAGLLNTASYNSRVAAPIREEGGRRFVDVDGASDVVWVGYTGYYTFATYNAAVRSRALLRFDMRIKGWDRIADYLAAVPLGSIGTWTIQDLTPNYFCGFSTYPDRLGALCLIVRPYRGKIWPWIYTGERLWTSAQGSCPLPESVISGDWVPCELRLLTVANAWRLVLLVDGVSVYTSDDLGSIGASGLTNFSLFDVSFYSSGTIYGPVPVIQMANVEYAYIGTADMAPPGVTISGIVGASSADLTAEVTFG